MRPGRAVPIADRSAPWVQNRLKQPRVVAIRLLRLAKTPRRSFATPRHTRSRPRHGWRHLMLRSPTRPTIPRLRNLWFLPDAWPKTPMREVVPPRKQIRRFRRPFLMRRHRHLQGYLRRKRPSPGCRRLRARLLSRGPADPGRLGNLPRQPHRCNRQARRRQSRRRPRKSCPRGAPAVLG